MAVVKSIALAKQTSRLLNLLNLVKEQLENFIKACGVNDLELAQKIVRNDLNINIEFHYIIDKSTWILTQHVILGEELRMLLAYNSIAKEFERLGDVISGLAINLVKSKDAVVSNNSIVNELTFIKNQLFTLEEIIKNPLKEKIIENLTIVRKHGSIYKDSKWDFINKIAISKEPKQIEVYVKHIRLLVRTDRLSDFLINSYEYIIYALTGKHLDDNYGEDT